MIIVKCSGGLGNQMFLYALYKNFKKRGREVYFDIDDYKNYNLHNGYELEDIFNLAIDYSENNYTKHLKVKENEYIKKIIRKFKPELISHKILHPYIYNNDIFSMRNVYLEGYGQNINYINTIEDELRYDFKFNLDLIDELNLNIIEEIERNENSVSIHVRRGDYINNTKAYDIYGGICEKNYYSNALKIIQERVSNANFYIFSNDIDWVKQNLRLKNATYINHNNGKDSYKDLILMSKCKHNIIANSTFSWWGAWLNENSNKNVIMPKRWTNYQENTLEYEGCILI